MRYSTRMHYECQKARSLTTLVMRQKTDQLESTGSGTDRYRYFKRWGIMDFEQLSAVA